MIKLYLCDTNSILCERWEKYFKKFDNVFIYNTYFQNIQKFDCIVSPANSFGLMDGGIDGAIVRYFGEDLMNHVQQHIIDNYYGEQPVGTSFVIKTGNEEHKYLAHTPTMRVPKDISTTDNVYNAMRAMLMEVLKYNDIKTVVCPGLGTLTGLMNYEKAAHLMYLAYSSILYPIKEINWNIADKIDSAIWRKI